MEKQVRQSDTFFFFLLLDLFPRVMLTVAILTLISFLVCLFLYLLASFGLAFQETQETVFAFFLVKVCTSTVKQKGERSFVKFLFDGEIFFFFFRLTSISLV